MDNFEHLDIIFIWRGSEGCIIALLKKQKEKPNFASFFLIYVLKTTH